MKKQNEQFLKSTIARLVAYQQGGKRELDPEELGATKEGQDLVSAIPNFPIEDRKEIAQALKDSLPSLKDGSTTKKATSFLYQLITDTMNEETKKVEVKKDGSKMVIIPSSFKKTISDHLPVISAIGGGAIGLGIAHMAKASTNWKVGGAIIGIAVGLAGSMAYQHYYAPEKSSGYIDNPCADNPNVNKRCYNPRGFCMTCHDTRGGSI